MIPQILSLFSYHVQMISIILWDPQIWQNPHSEPMNYQSHQTSVGTKLGRRVRLETWHVA